jgi:CSLREA domain-containing protein
VVLLALLATFSAASAARAATSSVTTPVDSDDGSCLSSLCSLRDAIKYSAPGNTVAVPRGMYALSLGDLVIDHSVSINGAGARTTVVSGQNRFRVFTITNGDVSLSGLEVTGGNAGSATRTGVGGGIYDETGTLTLDSVSVDHNAANPSMFGTASGGGIDSNGSALTIIDSTVSSNIAVSTGSNGFAGGIDTEFGPAPTIVNSTIGNNTASGNGGGLSTNAATLINDTITGNNAGGMGGGVSAATSLSVKNTIVAGNVAQQGGDNCQPTPSGDLGHNLSNDTSCGFNSTGDHENVADPHLGNVQNNGGPTDTVALLDGSPAINSGDANGCPATDERAITRPQGAACDIGAFEAQLPTAVTGAGPQVGVSTASLTGALVANGLATTYHFEYGPSAAYGFSSPTQAAGNGTLTQNVSASLTGLQRGTTYHFRLVATSVVGTSYGTDQSLTTQIPPDAITGGASRITQTGAVLAGTASAHGLPTADCHFDYGPTVKYGSATACAQPRNMGSMPLAVSGTLDALAAGTRYHYRVVFTTAAGTAVGDDRSFRTVALAGRFKPEPTMAWDFKALRSYSLALSMVAYGVPSGSKVKLACAGRRCPFKSRIVHAGVRHTCKPRKNCHKSRPHTSTIDLTRFVKGSHFAVGTHLSVSFVKPRFFGKIFVLMFRPNRPPSHVVTCLAPGSSVPGRNC